jgi:ABC-type multidrug transport system ATPase subunit
LDDITLTAKCAEVLTLLGPNGSGKTTLLKLIATMLIPDGGELTVCGSDTKRAPGAVRRCVGFAVSSERSFFPRLTAWENLEFFSALDDIPRGHRREVIESVLEQVGLKEKKDELVAAFSSGMNQRLGLARALAIDSADSTWRLDRCFGNPQLRRGQRGERFCGDIARWKADQP